MVSKMWGFWPQKEGFEYEIVEEGKVDPLYQDRTCWTLNKGIHKTKKTEVTIFTCALSESNKEQAELCRNCFIRTKTLKFPQVLNYLDGQETEKSLILVTEPVTPLFMYLNDNDEEETQSKEFLSWGLRCVIQGLENLHRGGFIHGNLGLHSVYVDKCGDWKIWGLDYTSQIANINPASPPKMNHLRMYHVNLPPELKSPELLKDNWQLVEQASVWATDAWSLGLMLFELFNTRISANMPPSALKNAGKMPRSLFTAYMGLMNGIAKMRTNPAALLVDCDYFQNEYVELQDQLQNMVLIIKDTLEMDTFLRKLNSQDTMKSFPKANCKYKILPKLVEATKYGAGSTAALHTILKLGELLTMEEFQSLVIPGITALFVSSDITVRSQLLQNADSYVKNFTPTALAEIWPHLADGFQPTRPAQVRELSVKSLIHFVPQLPEKIVNNDVVRVIWLMLGDAEGNIRANTAVCLSMLASSLSTEVRKKVLFEAFKRSLGDVYPQARIAGCKALTATVDFYNTEQMAKQILPVVVTLTVDGAKDVRKEAFKCCNTFLSKLHKVSELTSGGGGSTTNNAGKSSSGTATGADIRHSSVGSSDARGANMTSTTSPNRTANKQPSATVEEDEYDDYDEEEEQEDWDEDDDKPPAAGGWGDDDDWSDDATPAPKPVPATTTTRAPKSKGLGMSASTTSSSSGTSLAALKRTPVKKTGLGGKKAD